MRTSPFRLKMKKAEIMVSRAKGGVVRGIGRRGSTCTCRGEEGEAPKSPATFLSFASEVVWVSAFDLQIASKQRKDEAERGLG